jgi:branched-chain amino acid aminotransferase
MPNPVPVLSNDAWLLAQRAARGRAGAAAYSFFSSWTGGITTDPALMQVPVDDHLVHRGDGVFETLKCAGGGLYQLDAHLERLFRGAEALGLRPSVDRNEAAAIVVATTRAGERPDCLVRVLVSRGPGGFGVDPAECPHPGLYVATYPGPPPFMTRCPTGARVGLSTVPVKPSLLAVNKTCNYLPNVLMKAEANRRGLHFVIGRDADGSLTESFTENLFLLDAEGWLVVPEAEQILAGTTLERALALAAPFVAAGELAGLRRARLHPKDVWQAREVFIAGTTAHLTAVVDFEGRPIGNGRPGPWHARLAPLLDADIAGNAALRTPVFSATIDPTRP